jgi:hypothetical protein
MRLEYFCITFHELSDYLFYQLLGILSDIEIVVIQPLPLFTSTISTLLLGLELTIPGNATPPLFAFYHILFVVG